MSNFHVELGKDFERCLQAAKRADDLERQCWLRMAYRAAFDFIEALQAALHKHLHRHIKDRETLIPDEEARRYLSHLYFVTTPKEMVLESNGEVATKKRILNFKPRLMAHVKMWLIVSGKTRDEAMHYFGRSPHWNKMLAAVGKRNTITHPSSVADIEVTEADVDNLLGAVAFIHELDLKFE